MYPMIPTTDDIRRLLDDGMPRTVWDIADAFGAEPTPDCRVRIYRRLISLQKFGFVQKDVSMKVHSNSAPTWRRAG